jgi:hypothetical protein
MAWWDDAAEALGSGVGWLGDAAEAVVDTATEVVEEVTESGSDAADAGLDALRDGAASVGPDADPQVKSPDGPDARCATS